MSETTMEELTRKFREGSREIRRIEAEQGTFIEDAVNFAHWRITVELPEAGCHLDSLPEYGTWSPSEPEASAQRAISDLAQATDTFFSILDDDEDSLFLAGPSPYIAARGQCQLGAAWKKIVGDAACWAYYVFSGDEYKDQVLFPCWLLDWDADDVASIVNAMEREAERG